MKIKNLLYLILSLFLTNLISSHHFKGLPHYGYFENYPQTPIDEYLAQAGNFEFFLVVYDFQGFERKSVEEPDDVRFFVNIYDLKKDRAYNGPIKLEVMNGEKTVSSVHFKSAEQESLYYYSYKIKTKGDLSVRVTLLKVKSDNKVSSSPLVKKDELKNNGLPVMNRMTRAELITHEFSKIEVGVIPFELSSQKVSWGLWLLSILIILIVIAAVGSRKKRILSDRKGIT